MNFKIGLFAVCFAALMGVLSTGCKSKCSTLSDTCAKCLDAQTQESCTSVVNTGNSDTCDSENQLLSGFCK